jgi:MYXO-CTERM domain-containing protein
MMECRGGSCCDGKPETCDGKDNDCDGKIDEGAPGGGQPCQDNATGRSGKTRCQSGKLVCVPDPVQEPPPTEVVEEAASESNASEPPSEPNESESLPDASPDAVAPEDIDTENPPETIYPEWPSYCQAFPEACKEGVLNLRTLQVGEVGCEEMSDCRTQLCVKREGVGRCALACRDQSDCPARFECIEGSICWPKPGASSADIQPCREPRDCQSDERCVSGVCVGGKDRCVGGYCPGGSGASCACSASANDPFSPLLWLGLLLLLPLWRRSIARL